MRQIRFHNGRIRYAMSRSQGWMVDPPAYIHPRILFGSGMALTTAFVEKHSITHVLNCAFDQDCPTWFPANFPKNYRCLNAIDSLDVNILDWYNSFETTIAAFLKDEDCKNIYIHCQCGINRSGFLCLNFMVQKLKIELNDAIKAILRQRPCALTNPSFRHQVISNSLSTFTKKFEKT